MSEDTLIVLIVSIVVIDILYLSWPGIKRLVKRCGRNNIQTPIDEATYYHL